MNDEKRFLRELKRSVKKAGNRKRRRYLKDISAAAEDFSFGRDRTDVMNEKPRKKNIARTQSSEPSPIDQPGAESTGILPAGCAEILPAGCAPDDIAGRPAPD
jgi:hypothetical protein